MNVILRRDEKLILGAVEGSPKETINQTQFSKVIFFEMDFENIDTWTRLDTLHAISVG